MGDAVETPTLKDYVAVIRRRWVWIAATTVAVLAVVLGLTALQNTTYQSSAEIALQPPGERDALRGIVFGSSELGTQRQILTSTPLVREVLDEYGLVYDPSDVREFIDDHVQVEVVEEATILRVQVEVADAERAAALAQGLAEGYLAYLERDASSRLRNAIVDLESEARVVNEQLNSLEQQIAAGAGGTQQSLEEERDALYAQLRFVATRTIELETIGAFARRGEITQPAIVPESPASPNPLRNAIFALLLGVILGAGVAIVREIAADDVRDRRGIRSAGGVDLLGVVRRPERRQELSVLMEPNNELRESYQRLRGGLLSRQSLHRGPLRLAVLPTAAGGDENAVALNTAVALAQSGRRVLVLDAHLSRGSESQALSLDGPGVSQLLEGSARLADVVLTPFPGVRLVPAGSASSDAAALLGGDRFRQLVDTAVSDGEDLIVMAPPVEAGAEAADLAAALGYVLIVARRGSSGRTALRTAVETVNSVGAAVVGTVLVERSASGLRRTPDLDTADYPRDFSSSAVESGTPGSVGRP